MTFRDLLDRFTVASGHYHDTIYGWFRGRAEIGRMLETLWHREATDYRWGMFDHVTDGRIGYAHWLFSYTVTMAGFAGRRPVVSGASRLARGRLDPRLRRMGRCGLHDGPAGSRSRTRGQAPAPDRRRAARPTRGGPLPRALAARARGF